MHVSCICIICTHTNRAASRYRVAKLPSTTYEPYTAPSMTVVVASLFSAAVLAVVFGSEAEIFCAVRHAASILFTVSPALFAGCPPLSRSWIRLVERAALSPQNLVFTKKTLLIDRGFRRNSSIVYILHYVTHPTIIHVSNAFIR